MEVAPPAVPTQRSVSAARSTSRDEKCYVVVRGDLSVGAQLTQGAHVALELALREPEATRSWDERSGSIILCTTPDLAALEALRARAEARGISCVSFCEHDLADELTAVALLPGAETRRLCSSLPLAGKLTDTSLERDLAARSRERDLRGLVEEMEDCEQTAGLSVLDHGRSVWRHYQQLRSYLDTGEAPEGAVIPDWLSSHRELLRDQQEPSWVVERYTVLHDCGKPSVRTLDEEGRVHFPDHTATSARTFAAAYGLDLDLEPTCELERGLHTAHRLIAADMALHTCSAAEVPALVAQGLVPTQLIVALSELHANAEMFGGTDSVGFKMKLKHLTKRARAACRILSEVSP